MTVWNKGVNTWHSFTEGCYVCTVVLYIFIGLAMLYGHCVNNGNKSCCLCFVKVQCSLYKIYFIAEAANDNLMTVLIILHFAFYDVSNLILFANHEHESKIDP